MITDERVLNAIEALSNVDDEVTISARFKGLGLEIKRETRDILKLVLAAATVEAVERFAKTGAPIEDSAAAAMLIPLIMGMELQRQLTDEEG